MPRYWPDSAGLSMTDITLVRRECRALTEVELAGARRMIFEMVDGLNEADQKAWRRMWRLLLEMAPGEIAKVKPRIERIPAFHCRHMRIERLIYEAQENFTDFELGFREWLKVGAGWCDWGNDANGRLTLITRSTSFKETEEVEMREFHDRALEFLRSDRGAPVLWPNMTPLEAMNYMNQLLGEMGE